MTVGQMIVEQMMAGQMIECQPEGNVSDSVREGDLLRCIGSKNIV